MNDARPLRRPPVRLDFVPSDAYVQPRYVEIEEQKLWPRVWLLACREEELEKVGDFVTFDIGKESILIVKAKPGQIAAWLREPGVRTGLLTVFVQHTSASQSARSPIGVSDQT